MKFPDICIDPKRRHEFVYLFDVTNGNPNGDPDGGNMPRIDPETNHGLVTDVALKRKVRDYVSLTQQDKEGYKIFIQSQAALNTLILQAFRDVGIEAPQIEINKDDAELIEWLKEKAPEEVFELDEDNQKLTYLGTSTSKKDISKSFMQDLERADIPKDIPAKLGDIATEIAKIAKGKKISKGKRDEARQRMCKDYYDIRMFGAVLSTGLNAGQVRGPLQFTFAQSRDPVYPRDLSITRKAITKASDMAEKETEMGRKPLVHYGLYLAQGFYNNFLGAGPQGTGVVEKDLELLWEALGELFTYNRSASKGLMACRGLYVFSHGCEKGNAPAHKLFERIKVEKLLNDKEKPPRAFSDYEVKPDLSELKAGDASVRIVDASEVKKGGDLKDRVVLTRLFEG